MVQLDDKSAEGVFKLICKTKRKLLVRDWNEETLAENKRQIIELLKLGALGFNSETEQITYYLEVPIKEETITKVDFSKRISIQQREKASEKHKNATDKGVAVISNECGLKFHEYEMLDTSDDEFITLIWASFLR